MSDWDRVKAELDRWLSKNFSLADPLQISLSLTSHQDEKTSQTIERLRSDGFSVFVVADEQQAGSAPRLHLYLQYD